MPGPEVREHFAADFMSDTGARDIALASFIETGARLRDLGLFDVIAGDRVA